MHIITLAAQKGGVGKTTLAVNLAVAAQAAGVRTALFDLDPQESATAWSERREAEHDETTGERRAKLKRLGAAVRELQVYIHRNAGSVVDYGERFRAGERISSGFVESAINQVVSKRFSKRQSMRWTRRGAHLTLQTRTRVLNGELEGAFRRRWPGFRAERAA